MEGRVARMTDVGAFIELETGVDALLHVSQIARERIEKPSDVLTLGQEVTVKIVDLDLDAKKISLSMKALLPRPERPRNNRNDRRNNEPRDDADEAFIDIDAFVRRMDAEDARKEARAAREAAKEAAEAVEAVQEEVQETAEAVAEEVQDVVEAVPEAAEEAVAEEAAEVVAEAVEAPEE